MPFPSRLSHNIEQFPVLYTVILLINWSVSYSIVSTSPIYITCLSALEFENPALGANSCGFSNNCYLSLSPCCCSVALLCLTLCDPMDCRTPSFPVLHYVPEFAQT